MTAGGEAPKIRCHIYFQAWLRAVWQTIASNFSISQPCFLEMWQTRSWMSFNLMLMSKLKEQLCNSSKKQSILPYQRTSILQTISCCATFIKNHTLTTAQQTPTSLNRQGPLCINLSTREMKKKVARPSWDAINLMRFPEFLWIEPDAKYLTSNKLTSNYWCGALLPDVQQMGPGRPKVSQPTLSVILQ